MTSLYSYVPAQAVGSVETNGLLGSTAIAKRPDLLELARPDKKDRKAWLKAFIAQKMQPHRKGPNALFKLPPKDTKLPDSHPTNKPGQYFKIDVDQLLKDRPDTKFHGLELEPIDKLDKAMAADGLKPEDWDVLPSKVKQHYKSRRYKQLDVEALRTLARKHAKTLWKDYSGTDGMYAPNVPHAAIMTSNGIVEPKYLSKVALDLDIEVGDTLLGGRFKNVPMVVEEIGTDELGQPTVNGRKLLSYRIKKKMPNG